MNNPILCPVCHGDGFLHGNKDDNCLNCDGLGVIAKRIEIDDDDIEVCDCGIPFPKSGYCKYCGTHARYLG